MTFDGTRKYTIYSFIRGYLKPFHWQVIGLMLVACYWAIHVSLQPYVIKLILDHASQSLTFLNLLIPTIFYILLSIAAPINSKFHNYLCLNLYPQLKANIMSDASNRISHYSYSFFQNQFSGTISDKIKNLGKGSQEIVEIIINKFFGRFLALIVACITLATVHPILPYILLIWTAILVIISISITRRARDLSLDLSEANSRVMGSIVDRLANILNVRLFDNYIYERKELDTKLSEMVEKDKRLIWFFLKVVLAQGLATSVMISASLIVLTLFVHSKNITIGDFGLVLTLSLSFADIIFLFAMEVSKFSEVYGMVSQGIALMNRDVEVRDVLNAQELKVINGEIRFDKVHFSYPTAEPLFSNKSITIPGGQKIGLVGYSGAGKSTFVNLILRLYDVDEGKILIDEQDIKMVTQSSLHRSIGMIPQDPTLFHRSLMENIRYGITDCTDEEVIAAAKKAHAHDFIERLPLGYETLVGERGIKLSGGQRQRVAIARALLKNAPILLLDEATSALDSVTEAIIKDSLVDLMEGKTTIVVAHRLSTLLHMDRILVFEKGQILEDGPHKELLAKGGLYKTLWDAQVGGFIQDKPNQSEEVDVSNLTSENEAIKEEL